MLPNLRRQDGRDDFPKNLFWAPPRRVAAGQASAHASKPYMRCSKFRSGRDRPGA